MDDFAEGFRLRQLLEQAARGSYPPADWATEVVAAPPRLRGAVVAFTGRHLIAADLEPMEVETRVNTEDMADAGTGDDWLQVTYEPPENERVRRARSQRIDTVFLEPAEGGAIVTIGAGLADRREISMEITGEANRNRGYGTRLVRAAVDHVPADEAIFATAAPGNARSVRCLFNAGFRPIGSEWLFT